MHNRNWSKKIFIGAMILPVLLFLIVMTIYPLATTLIYSLTDFELLKDEIQFISFENYIELIKDDNFKNAVGITIKFTLLSLLCEMIIGFSIAIYVNSLKNNFFQKILRTVLLIPSLLPTVTVALSWRMMFSVNYGFVNKVLEGLGFNTYNWFSDINTAFKMLVVVDVWQNTPIVFLLLYSALQTIPKEQYEAAKMDGANKLQSVINVTIPNMKMQLVVCAMIRTIDAFRIFDKVNLLTGGGPANSTTTISQYIYKYGIKTLEFGYASAGIIIMTLIVVTFSCPYIKKMMRGKNV